MSSPRVTIGLPVYNGARYLRRAIDSILGQDYADFELVISDNASTDGTSEICHEYTLRDPRVRYHRNEVNVGIAANHNRAFALSRGQYFKWAAHDDEYPTQMLTRCVAALDAAPSSASLVFTPCEIIDEDGKLLGVKSDPVTSESPRPYRRLASLVRNNSIFNFTYGLIRSETLRKTRLHGPFPSADWVLFAELAMLGELREVPQALLRLRFHEGRSVESQRDPQSLRILYDPTASSRRHWLSVESKAHFELLRSAARVPSGLPEKCMCLATALFVPWWREFVNYGGRQKKLWKTKLGGKRYDQISKGGAG